MNIKPTSGHKHFFENRAIFFTAISSQTSAYIDENIRSSLRSVSDWGFLLKYLIHHGTLVSFSNHVSRLQLKEYIPDSVAEDLRRTELILRYRNSRYTDEIKKVAQLFNTSEVPIVFLKGSMFLLSGYYDDEGRFMNDVDFFIHDKDVAKAKELLRSIHYRESASGSQENRYHYKGEIVFVSSDDREIMIEMSTRLNKNVELRKCYPFQEDDLWDKLSRKLVNDVVFLEVEKEFHFAYCLFHHVALNYLHRLNWLDDLYLMVNDQEMDFDKVARYIEKYRLHKSSQLLSSIFTHHFHMNSRLPAAKVAIGLQKIYLADSCPFINLENLELSNVSVRFLLINGGWNKVLVVLNKLFLPARWLREYYGLGSHTSSFVVYFLHYFNSIKRLLKVR